MISSSFLPQAQDSQAVEKKRRFAEAARERAIEEEALRQRDLAKETAKIAEEKIKKNAEKKQVDAFLSTMEATEETSTAEKDEPIIVLPSEPEAAAVPEGESSDDLMAGFFSELSEASKEKERIKEEKSNQARELLLTEKYTNQDLGTGKSQYERLTQTNYVWKNQNPYVVMQLGIDATEEDIKYR
jgi:hypothetical protein